MAGPAEKASALDPQLPPLGPGRAFGGGQVSLARSTVTLLVAHIAASVLGAVRSLYLARTMLPADFGIWSLVTTVLTYANYSDLGINWGYILRISNLLGRGETADADRLRRHTLTAVILVPGSVTAVLLIASFLPVSVIGAFGFTIRIVAAAVAALSLLNYLHVNARLEDRWRGISAATFTTAVVATAAVMLAGAWTGRVSVETAALASVAATTAAVIMLAWRHPPRAAWPLDRNLLRSLIGIGLPISLFPLGLVLFQSLDRWIVAGTVSSLELGYYGLGTTLGAFLYMVPTTLAVILFTRQIADFGATGDPAASEALVLPPIQASAYIMAWLSGGVLLGLPFVTAHLTPEYGPALQVAELQVVGNCLLFSIPVGSSYLISVDRQRILFALLAAAIVFEATLVVVFVAAGFGIGGAAWAVVIADIVFSATVAFACFVRLGLGRGAAVRYVCQCFLPFALCVPVAVGLSFALPVGGGAIMDAAMALGFALMYALAAGVLCAGAGRFTGLFGQPLLAAHVRTWLPASLANVLIGR